MTYLVKHFIDGQVTEGTGSHQEPLINPATSEVSGKVVFASPSDVEHAIASAQKAFQTWSQTPPIKRSQILLTYQALIKQNIKELAQMITREHGKTLVDAEGSIQRGIEVLEFACGVQSHMTGVFTENVGTKVDSYSILQPLGVCVGITPFNFPAMIPLWMFPIAVACGNTFILKPSERDPSCALRLAELFTEAGAPKGVLNVINGGKDVVDILLRHPTVKAVSFVGSTPVAEYVYTTATQHGKRAQAFGGAKNHGVVMPDADLEQTLDAIVGAGYGSAGQRCMALSVIVAVGDQTADNLVAGIQKRLETLKIGPGDKPDVEMGPLVNQQQLKRVLDYVEIGVQEGAKLVVDGRNYKPQGYEKGCFMGPCLFDHVTPNMKIYKEEIFGPVLTIVRVPDLGTALNYINEHEFGNGTAIFTRDGETARTFASEVQAGMIGINVPIPVPIAYHNFGGWKRSIFGDTQMHGPESIRFYTKRKTITSRWPTGKTKVQMSMPTME